MKQPAVDDEDPDRPMTRKGRDGRAHETKATVERSRGSQQQREEDREPAPLPIKTPPD